MDCSLDQISNVRLLWIKQKILLWKFEVIHVPGKTNYFADATSRCPAKQLEIDGTEAEIAAFNHASIAITTGEVEACAAADNKYASMLRARSDNKHVRQVSTAVGQSIRLRGPPVLRRPARHTEEPQGESA